jgi:putative RNA 2'-phosphotransferase
MSKHFERTSKFLSLVLRHSPETIGLRLDNEGWAEVEELISSANAKGHDLSRELLIEVVSSNDKQRFAFNDSGTKIRANQGHSISVDLKLSSQVPPPQLFHGTATRFEASIRKEGLRPRSRQYVHLSSSVEVATTVGTRHGKPLVLRIHAEQMHRDGIVFYLSENGVWLTESVPVEYIKFEGS